MHCPTQTQPSAVHPNSSMSLWYTETYNDSVRLGLRLTETIYRTQSPLQLIEIVDTVEFGRTLAIDGIYMTSEKDEHYYHEMLVHPALVTVPSAKRVLIIGGGDGGTAREVLRHPHIEKVTMVEIDGAVVEACKKYLPNLGAWGDPRLEVLIQDGIHYVHNAKVEPFDVILLDGSDPIGPAKGLFDIHFYRGVKQLLAPGGVFALQSESPILMRNTFLDVVRTLRTIFAHAKPYFGPVPIYGASIWSWTFATDTVNPMEIHSITSDAIEEKCKYYNRDIHRGAFAVPNDLQRLLG